MSAPWILGLAASHGGAACLLHGHHIVCAIQEERLTRVKHAPLAAGREFLALDYVLQAGGITVDDLDLVVCCPLQPPRGASDVSRHPRLKSRPRMVISHHLGHAISAYACSGHSEATVIVIDAMGSRIECLSEAERDAVVGTGDREVMSIYAASGTTLRPIEKHLASHPADDPDADARPRMFPFVSLGTMYQTVAEQIFGSWHDAGTLMGLAAHGNPRWPVSAFLECTPTGIVFRDDIPRRFRHARRWPDAADDYRDLAASAQAALEAGVGWLVNRARQVAPHQHLCYAGGVALNLPANERHLFRGPFDDVFIQPAAEDAGTAIGAAYYGLWQLTGAHHPARLTDDGLGRRYGEVRTDTLAHVAELIAANRLVGWFEGGAEFGPRGLGHRSILANPCSAAVKVDLDRIKQREPFRPYAPAIRAAALSEWFELGAGSRSTDSPFMLRALPYRAARRSSVPAVMHADGTGRVQTVTPERGAFARLIDAVEARTGVPMVLNTSFNGRGQPIVETPDDARLTARALGLAACVIDGRVYEV